MRWRLYIFFLSATAIFCFVLLTAATAYGDRGVTAQLDMVRRTVDAPLSIRAADPLPEPLQIAAPAPAPLAPAKPEIYNFKAGPSDLALTLEPGPDRIEAWRKAKAEEKANRGKPGQRRLLNWDEDGWYREEVAMVTAYCPCSRCCGRFANGVTSIGGNAWEPGLAAEPEYLVYGTRVFVPGYGLSTVDDTGGAMRRHWKRNGVLHIDVRMTYHQEARLWGKQYLRVKIYE